MATDKSKEAMKLALDALDCIYSPLHVREINKVGAAITALREALAEQPAQRKPLMYEEITAISKQVAEGGPNDSIDRFVRAIEAAHNIKENT